MKYKAIIQIRKTFVKEILVELQKAKPDNIHSKEILLLIENILRYFNDEDSEEYMTSQGLLSI